MSHYLTHLPLHEVPVTCPCDPDKYRFKTIGGLRNHARQFNQDEDHLKHKLKFSKSNIHPIEHWECDVNYHFACRCVQNDYSKGYEQVSIDRKFRIRRREQEIRAKNRAFSNHLLGFGLNMHKMSKEEIRSMFKDVLEDFIEKREQNTIDNATVKD